MFPGVAPYESILSDMIRGWDSKRHEHVDFPIPTARPIIPHRSSSDATAVPHNGNVPTINAFGTQNIDWSMPDPIAPADADWMTALLNDNAFTQNHAGPSNGSSQGHNSSNQQNGQQTLTEDMGSWTPLFGSPRSTEAFSDQWGGTLIQMGGQVTGPVRDDFFT
jgi:hypothetical protein